MEVITINMRTVCFFVLSLFLVSGMKAQNQPDPVIFADPVLVTPQPPKAIKGWDYIENYQLGEPALIGTYPGKIIKFPFKGTAVGIAVSSGPDAGMIEFSVDDANWQKVDLFSGSNERNQVTYFTLESNLKNKKHILQLRTTDEKNKENQGKKCILCYFYFNQVE